MDSSAVAALLLFFLLSQAWQQDAAQVQAQVQVQEAHK